MQLLLKRIDGEDELPERRLVIDHGTAIQIGRASKTEQKQLIPAISNGWIRNPVISRNHAVFTLESLGMTPAVVFIQDKKSSHGTFVNGENIKDNKHPLQNGDKIRFGSEVMRGEETFRPPVFDFQISFNESSSSNTSADVTIIEKTTAGITITVPDESGAESDGEDNMSSEDSIPSVRAMSGRHSDSFLGSQANPWTIDEADLIPDSEFIAGVADDHDDEAESESNISDIYDEDVDEDHLDMDEDEEPLDMSDEEESEIEDHDSEDIAESPIYTPKSPRYVHGEAESTSAVRGYTPPQFGNDAGYWDGPFASYNWTRANDSMFASAQPWGMETSQQAARVTNVFPSASQAELPVPQHSAFTHAISESSSLPVNSLKVTSTREMLDQTRRVYNKADMSIHNLINPSPGKESSIAGTKRKADELEAEEDEAVVEPEAAEVAVAVAVADVASLPAVPQSEVVAENIETDKLPQTPESLNKEPIESPAPAAVVPITVTTEPPRKKLRTMAKKAAIFGSGVIAGGVGVLVGLMSLPEGYFQ